jgi:uroporphyrinogen decarboxylase
VWSGRFSEVIPFRERSETPEIAIELSLQPWRAFQPDGVIFFSDILTPLPAIGVEFDVIRGKVKPRAPSRLVHKSNA